MLTVGDVMTRSVVTVKASTPLKAVAEILIERGISGVPVVDDAGTVVGVVSEADFLFKESGPEERRQSRLGRLFGDSKATEARQQKLSATTAGEAMTSPPICVRPTQTIAEAARLMSGQLVNRLVVMDDSRLAGIVSRADLVRAFVRTDEELETTIREEVLLRIMWLDPAGFQVRVVNGVASIVGHAERRSTAEAIETTVAMVPGIVGVKADITWSLDDAKAQPATVDAFFPYSPR
ncbi:MAG TPA: CBS domain-containing protein [Candidatus Limnocylindrales bacterium]|nr:CBS domain-containing protein [Candidatus Limnocylindrales bacterium]